MNPENSVSENFLGEERNFPRFGPGMNPSPPSAARATFLALIVGNSVPPLENFRKHYNLTSVSYNTSSYKKILHVGKYVLSFMAAMI